ncbi:RNA polymerase-binding protein RbpA [Arthrobacter sp. GCM10027362]|uniref:RNA polymerase-binding protein RbpA n=1 Tax=Arthrobacter sp. GCM10027362 TaxID=3273379 RepID=UPI003630DF40
MANASNPFRGIRIGSASGAGLAGWQAETGRSPVDVHKLPVTYRCPQGHETTPVFADLAEEEIPEYWDCPRCGRTGTRRPEAVFGDSRTEPYKSHLDYAKERRSPAEAEEVLARALGELRRSRGEAT